MNQTIHHQLEYTGNAEFSTYVYEQSEACPSLHFHKNFEILLVTEGECDCSVGGKDYVLHKNDAAVILPFQIHSFTVRDDSSVRCTVFHEHLILTLAQSIEGTTSEKPLFHPSPSVTDFFLTQMTLCYGKESGMQKRITPLSKRMKIKGCLYAICSEFMEQARFIPTKGVDAITLTVVQYISENFQHDISLRDVAQSTGYNYQYLSRTFNQNLGVNFKKLLNQYRMEHAFALLQDTDLPIAQIAFESGFQSIRSFDHVCQETFHKSPLQLRRDSLQSS